MEGTTRGPVADRSPTLDTRTHPPQGEGVGAVHTAHRGDSAHLAHREATVELLHGREVADPYRWLEDGDDPRCEEWLTRQEDLLVRHRASWPDRATMGALLEESCVPGVRPPVWRAGRRFQMRAARDRQLPELRVTDPGGAERTLVDPLALDPAGTTTLDAWRPSPSGNLLAFHLSFRGDERPKLLVTDVTDGRVVDGPLTPGRTTPVAWLPDDSGFYYVSSPREVGAAGRCLRFHRIGAHPDEDPELFTTDLPQLSVTISPDARWLMLSAAPGATSGNLLWLVSDPHPPHLAPPATPATAQGTAPSRQVLVHDGTREGARAVLRFAPGGRIYAITDSDAPFGRVCAVDPAAPHSTRWRTVIDEKDGSVLSDFAILTDPATHDPRLLLARSRHGSCELSLHDADGARVADVAPPGHGSVTRLTAPPGGGQRAWFAYTDFTSPPAVHRFDLDTRRCVPEREPDPASGPVSEPVSGPGPGPTREDPTAVRTAAPAPTARRPPPRPLVHEVAYTSYDSTRVRMRLVVPPTGQGPRPTLLTAYGGFGASTPPSYSPAVNAWVRAGGVYAIASVRGGGELGTAWHEAGRGRHKPNAVADFVGAARWLVDEGWTTPARLAVKGGSHSGLLVAAAVTSRPELYAAAVCSDAVTDMIRYHRFGLGPLWTEEFGTSEDPAQFATLIGYSPYHRVRAGTSYPAVLLTCPRVDPRVDSLHTRKLAAALQHAAVPHPLRPVLLRCESDVGHGPRSLSRLRALQTDILAFCAAHTGLRPDPEAAGPN